MCAKVSLGIDNFLESKALTKKSRVALLTNATGVNSNLDMDLDLFMKEGFNVVKLFGPEHGIWGAVADGERVSNEIEPHYKIPIFSLYGEFKRPTSEMLEGIDTLIYDIQDVGLRFYTYIYTLAYMMEECGKKGIKVIVLDRPNPLSGKVEGPIIRRSFDSFVGGYNLALRYGLTIGELALYFNKRFNMNANLEVVKMNNWHRWMYYDDTSLLWNTPSPNLPSFEHTLLYVGTCLLEGINVSIGRGTVHPFKYIGAPWIEPQKLKDELEKSEHSGVRFRRRDFIPFSSKYKDEVCHGLEFFVTNKHDVNPLKLALDIVTILKKLYPYRLNWETADEGKGYHFDLLMGSDIYRKAIEEGKSFKELYEMWEKEEKDFEELSKEFWLYT